ncbi:hypothetical protein CN428_24540 [Bacillus cereus]|nr:hypothetical protein CN428_24540 [Bacillus cereus]
MYQVELMPFSLDRSIEKYCATIKKGITRYTILFEILVDDKTIEITSPDNDFWQDIESNSIDELKKTLYQQARLHSIYDNNPNASNSECAVLLEKPPLV